MPARSRASTSGTRSNLYSLPQILDGELSREDGSDGKRAYFSELFGTRLRYSGASIGYQLGAVVTGVAPLIATSLLAWTGGHWWLIAVYMVLLSLITIVATYLASETYEEDITAERPEERQAIAGEPT